MQRHLILAILLFAVTLFVSCAISLVALLGLPRDFFRTSRAPRSRFATRGFLGKAGLVVKNLFGLILVVIGIVLSLPVIPGPGLLIVAAGMVLLDLPGKRRFLHKLLSRPSLLPSINRLRAAFSRAPLIVD
jgi:hypothetical protein